MSLRCSVPSLATVPERIEFKLAVLVFRCLHGTATAYLADELRRVTESDSRRWLRSTSTSALVVPPTRRMTIGDRAFPVAGYVSGTRLHLLSLTRLL